MCTVTFIPLKDRIYISSNRDERRGRQAALAPAIYPRETGRLLFPKDGEAGGSWFAVHESGHVLVLLNGGWVKHQPRPPYRRSRGLVLLDLADSQDPANRFRCMHLNGIEPFTVIIWQEGRLIECRWDGKDKFQSGLDDRAAHIWSSVTLYNEAASGKRKQWFREWLEKNPSPPEEAVLHFHRFTGDGDPANDLLMNRADGMQTVSISCLSWSDRGAGFAYLDLAGTANYRQQLFFTKATRAIT